MQDDILVSVALGLFFGDVAGPNLLLDERLIAGHLLNLAAANQIGAAVADLREIGRRAEQPGTCEGRAHAGVFRAL